MLLWLLRLLFDWDSANVAHIARHGIEPEEVEEALLDPGRIGASAYTLGDERRSAYIAATDEERILVIVVTRRRLRIRLITARDATDRERRRYRRRAR